jgi:plasmid stabilization system protein ParE
MTLIVRPQANAEVTEAMSWLVARQWYTAAGALRRLWEAGLTAIETAPRLHPPAEDAPTGYEVRNYLLPKYGYRIVYQVRPDELLVVAFLRTSRRPGSWHDRLAPN